jgi:hypothetical protein
VDMLKKLLLIFLLLNTSHFLFGQIIISSPVVRQVFQRDLNNQALVTVTGVYTLAVDTIQVRFTPVRAGQGVDTGWLLLKGSPTGGLFKGSVSLRGGWYTMEVRGLLDGKMVGVSSKVDRVGVGEVFVISGQSNAGGSSLLEANETGSTDDRVNCANFISPRTYYTSLPFPNRADLSQFSIIEFSQLSKSSAIGPTGLGPYYWGKVGDALAARLNVPIMFFNTGWAGASVRAWRESAENPTIGVPSDFQFGDGTVNRYEVGYPYANLNSVLRYYGINLGIRAVLWMEGETQNLLNLAAARSNRPLPVTEASYLDNIQRLIRKTRQDLGNNKLAWVVSRTSYSGDLDCKSQTTPPPPPPAPSPIIVAAQNRAIVDPTLAPMFAGPFTDSIQVARLRERDQCVHFTGKGLDDAALAWVRTLTDRNRDNKNFFDLIEPIMADTIPSISLDCISSAAVRLSLPAGYTKYEWFGDNLSATGGKVEGRVVEVPQGEYAARVTRSNGNIIQIPKFFVRASTPPKAPIVTALGDVNFCIGTSVTLQSSTEVDAPIYEWTSTPAITNLPRTRNLAASREGTYRLRVIDKSACASPYSTEVRLVAKPRPEKPTISTSGSTEFCEGQTIVLTSSNVGASSYLWTPNGENTQVITVSKGGSYSVQTRGANGCLSQNSTDNIFVVVNPLPKAPQIRALSDTVFCEGGTVSLVSTPTDNSTRFAWSRNNAFNNADNSATLRVSETQQIRGFVVDTKNCRSNASNLIQVVKKDNPKTLTIVPKSTYTLVARSSAKADEYLWKLDGKSITAKDSILKVIDKGGYTVIGKNVYPIRSSPNNPLTCFSSESEKYDFSPYDDKGLSVFPNPSNGIFNLESRYDLDKVVVTIYTITGKQLYQGKIETLNKQYSLDLRALPEGTYVLGVESSTFKLSKLISIVR